MGKTTLNVGEKVRFGENVVVSGTVVIGDETSIWHNVILRGDVMPITIGARCNIQDGTIMHGQRDQYATTLGNDITVGHACIVHGCELADRSFIGMGSMLMNGSFIGSNVMVAAGSLIPPGARFDEPYTLVMGRPGKVVRALKEVEIKMINETAGHYIGFAEEWLRIVEK